MTTERLDVTRKFPAGIPDSGDGLILQAELNRQSQILAKLFAKELGMTEDEYRASLPKFESQPKAWEERSGTLVIVEIRVPIERVCQLAGVDCPPEGLNKNNWGGDPQDYAVRKTPYIVRTDEGAGNMNRSVEDVRRELAFGKQGGTDAEGVALYIVKPHILKIRFLDLPGTAVGSGGALYLRLWNNKPRFGYRSVRSADPRFGSLICERQRI